MLECISSEGYYDGVKYWEMVAKDLKEDGWSLGWFKYVHASDGLAIWSADATQGDGRRLIVHAEDLTIAFSELEARCKR